jgi:S-(hydroxymethyl)glutathione dehydrogenase/alcohol dehydrogenase
MKTRAAVAWKAGAPLDIETIDIEGPKAGEVLVEIKATGICHTDAYTLSGADPEGLFPAILGHEGAGIVRDVGAGVTTLKAGDHVIPLYTPECRQCKTCLSRRSNLCTAIRATQGKGVMPDGTSRFRCDGDAVFHYMGCSTFANFTVLPEIALAKVRCRRRHQRREGMAGGKCRRVRSWRHRSQRHPGRAYGWRRQDRRHRYQPRQKSDGRKVRHDAFH